MAKLNSAMALNNAATIVVDSAEHKPSVTNDALYRLFCFGLTKDVDPQRSWPVSRASSCVMTQATDLVL
jgi:hypothetical protein